jgi:ribose 5-phosphate isomerase B
MERQFSTIHIATDHAGFSHAHGVATWLKQEGFIVVMHGAVTYDASDDFPVFMQRAGLAISGATESASAALVFGGSGQGEAMAMNRHTGVRATVYYGGSDDIILLSRQHNNANTLSIGARFVTIEEAKRVIWLWLHTAASTDEKYERRNQMLDVLY